jgi:hypothetical protein
LIWPVRRDVAATTTEWLRRCTTTEIRSSIQIVRMATMALARRVQDTASAMPRKQLAEAERAHVEKTKSYPKKVPAMPAARGRKVPNSTYTWKASVGITHVNRVSRKSGAVPARRRRAKPRAGGAE